MLTSASSVCHNTPQCATAHRSNLKLSVRSYRSLNLRLLSTVEVSKVPIVHCPLSIVHCQFIRTFLQKVIPKQFRDFHKQFQVYARLFQHLVGVATVGVYCSSEPCDRPPLFFQLLPYHISDVKFLHKKVP